MCDKKPCDNCCHEEDLLCCMPLRHCCGGYSEHNNCCPHDRCCNHPCGGCDCCDGCCGCPFGPEPCCCKAMKCCKENKKNIEKLEGDVNALEGRVIRDEEKHQNDIDNINQLITDLAQKEQDDVDALTEKNQQQDDAIQGIIDDAVVNVGYNNNTNYITYKTRNGSPINVVKVPALDNSNKVPAEYLPSYVDDVIEGYYYNNNFYKDPAHTQLIQGEKGKIYVDITDGNNNTYRWSDTTYIEVSPTKFGKIAGTAYEGNNGAALESALATHTSNTTIHITAAERTAWNNKYDKPSTGIPKSDLASSVQASLDKADTALQQHQDISGKADKANMTAGTYRSVTVNSQGIVTAGTNPTTLAGYGITDAKIENGTITLGNNSITPITQHQDISGKQDVIQDLTDIRNGAAAGATALQPGDAFDSATQSGNTITFKKNGGSPFSFTLPADAGSQTINISGTQVTIETAINNLVTEINNLKAAILWEIDSNDNTKIIAKNGKGAEAAGFFDTTVS